MTLASRQSWILQWSLIYSTILWFNLAIQCTKTSNKRRILLAIAVPSLSIWVASFLMRELSSWKAQHHSLSRQLKASILVLIRSKLLWLWPTILCLTMLLADEYLLKLTFSLNAYIMSSWSLDNIWLTTIKSIRKITMKNIEGHEERIVRFILKWEIRWV